MLTTNHIRNSPIGYSIFSGVFVTTVILLFELYSLNRFPTERQSFHFFSPAAAIILIILSSYLGKMLSIKFVHSHNYFLISILTGTIYCALMSLGALLNNILYPYDCVVPFVGVHVACAA